MGGNIPTGRITINGVVLDSGIDPSSNSQVRLSVLTKDPYTGETIVLENVVLKQSNPAIPDAIEDSQPVIITAANYDAYRRRNTKAMSATVAPSKVIPVNKGLPEHVKVKSKLDTFSSRPSTVCKSFQDKVDDMNERMGMVYKRKDITILQGRDSGASPSIIIHQGNGDVCMSDGNGKQYININGSKGIALSAGQIDMGSAIQSKNSIAYAGMNAYDNPVSEVLPQGTILTPHPKLLPNITVILNTIIPIMDLIDLGRACSEAYKVIYKAKSDKDRKESTDKITRLESNNTSESWNSKR